MPHPAVTDICKAIHYLVVHEEGKDIQSFMTASIMVVVA